MDVERSSVLPLMSNAVCDRTIYEKLASAFTEELAVLYHQRVEEISPNIRYCAYNIGECTPTHTQIHTLPCASPHFQPLPSPSPGDQNAINDLMQMRLAAGGGGGMMAEKLEVCKHGCRSTLSPAVRFPVRPMLSVFCVPCPSRPSSLRREPSRPPP